MKRVGLDGCVFHRRSNVVSVPLVRGLMKERSVLGRPTGLPSPTARLLASQSGWTRLVTDKRESFRSLEFLVDSIDQVVVAVRI